MTPKRRTGVGRGLSAHGPFEGLRNDPVAMAKVLEEYMAILKHRRESSRLLSEWD